MGQAAPVTVIVLWKEELYAIAAAAKRVVEANAKQARGELPEGNNELGRAMGALLNAAWAGLYPLIDAKDDLVLVTASVPMPPNLLEQWEESQHALAVEFGPFTAPDRAEGESNG